MQFSQAAFVLSYLAAFAVAAPIAEPAPVAEAEGAAVDAAVLESRQNVGITSNEYTRYGCRQVIFFFARGSTEVGNMVSKACILDHTHYAMTQKKQTFYARSFNLE